MRTIRFVAAVMALIVGGTLAFAQEDGEGGRRARKAQKKRQEIDAMAREGLQDLLDESSSAKKLYEEAYGYAVFRVIKVAIGITGGGGEGVAVAKNDRNHPVYMEMGTGGLGVGLGGQKYRTIFFFETKEAFDKFIYSGWDGDAEANAAAGNKGANVAASFADGVAIFQLTDKGLLANADVSGTKYWTDDDLNRPFEPK